MLLALHLLQWLCRQKRQTWQQHRLMSASLPWSWSMCRLSMQPPYLQLRQSLLNWKLHQARFVAALLASALTTVVDACCKATNLQLKLCSQHVAPLFIPLRLAAQQHSLLSEPVQQACHQSVSESCRLVHLFMCACLLIKQSVVTPMLKLRFQHCLLLMLVCCHCRVRQCLRKSSRPSLHCNRRLTSYR